MGKSLLRCAPAAMMSAGMDKRLVIQQIVAHLDEEYGRCREAAKAASAAATDPQNKAENKYDTRGLEASYLARGQALQSAEIEQARHLFAALSLREFARGDAIALGALVEVEDGEARDVYFIGPAAGGVEVTADGVEVMVLTARSPLGQSLTGRRAGDELTGGARIISVR